MVAIKNKYNIQSSLAQYTHIVGLSYHYSLLWPGEGGGTRKPTTLTTNVTQSLLSSIPVPRARGHMAIAVITD